MQKLGILQKRNFCGKINYFYPWKSRKKKDITEYTNCGKENFAADGKCVENNCCSNFLRIRPNLTNQIAGVTGWKQILRTFICFLNWVWIKKVMVVLCVVGIVTIFKRDLSSTADDVTKRYLLCCGKNMQIKYEEKIKKNKLIVGLEGLVAGGCGRSFEADQETEYIRIMHDDVVCQPKSCETAMETFDSAIIVGSKIILHRTLARHGRQDVSLISVPITQYLTSRNIGAMDKQRTCHTLIYKLICETTVVKKLMWLSSYYTSRKYPLCEASSKGKLPVERSGADGRCTPTRLCNLPRCLAVQGGTDPEQEDPEDIGKYTLRHLFVYPPSFLLVLDKPRPLRCTGYSIGSSTSSNVLSHAPLSPAVKLANWRLCDLPMCVDLLPSRKQITEYSRLIDRMRLHCLREAQYSWLTTALRLRQPQDWSTAEYSWLTTGLRLHRSQVFSGTEFSNLSTDWYYFGGLLENGNDKSKKCNKLYNIKLLIYDDTKYEPAKLRPASESYIYSTRRHRAVHPAAGDREKGYLSASGANGEPLGHVRSRGLSPIGPTRHRPDCHERTNERRRVRLGIIREDIKFKTEHQCQLGSYCSVDKAVLVAASMGLSAKVIMTDIVLVEYYSEHTKSQLETNCSRMGAQYQKMFTWRRQGSDYVCRFREVSGLSRGCSKQGYNSLDVELRLNEGFHLMNKQNMGIWDIQLNYLLVELIYVEQHLFVELNNQSTCRTFDSKNTTTTIRLLSDHKTNDQPTTITAGLTPLRSLDFPKQSTERQESFVPDLVHGGMHNKFNHIGIKVVCKVFFVVPKTGIKSEREGHINKCQLHKMYGTCIHNLRCETNPQHYIQHSTISSNPLEQCCGVIEAQIVNRDVSTKIVVGVRNEMTNKMDDSIKSDMEYSEKINSLKSYCRGSVNEKSDLPFVLAELLLYIYSPGMETNCQKLPQVRRKDHFGNLGSFCGDLAKKTEKPNVHGFPSYVRSNCWKVIRKTFISKIGKFKMNKINDQNIIEAQVADLAYSVEQECLALKKLHARIRRFGKVEDILFWTNYCFEINGESTLPTIEQIWRDSVTKSGLVDDLIMSSSMTISECTRTYKNPVVPLATFGNDARSITGFNSLYGNRKAIKWMYIAGPKGVIKTRISTYRDLNLSIVRLSACLLMGQNSDMTLRIGNEYIGLSTDWNFIPNGSKITVLPRLRGGVGKLYLTPLSGQYIIVLRALLAQSGDPLIIMGFAEIYNVARDHCTLLEEIQHHLIGSVTTVTQLWDALAKYAVEGQPDDLKNLAIVVDGLTSDVSRDRVRVHATSIVRLGILQRLHRLCAETDDVMLHVWVNVLAATWDLRVGSGTTVALRYGELGQIGWTVVTERLTRRYIDQSAMIMSALLMTMCRDGNVIRARTGPIVHADSMMTHVRDCTLFVLRNFKHFLEMLVDIDDRTTSCVIRDALLGVLVAVDQVPVWPCEQSYATALASSLVASRPVYQSTAAERERIRVERESEWLACNGAGYLMPVATPATSNLSRGELSDILRRATMDVNVIAPDDHLLEVDAFRIRPPRETFFAPVYNLFTGSTSIQTNELEPRWMMLVPMFKHRRLSAAAMVAGAVYRLLPKALPTRIVKGPYSMHSFDPQSPTIRSRTVQLRDSILGKKRIHLLVASVIIAALRDQRPDCMQARNRGVNAYRNILGPEPPAGPTGTIQDILHVLCPPAGQEPRHFTCPEHVREMLINVAEAPLDIGNRRRALYQIGIASDEFIYSASNILVGGIPDSFDGDEVLNLAQYVLDVMKLSSAEAYVRDVGSERYRFLHDPAGFFTAVIDLAEAVRFGINGGNSSIRALVTMIMYKDVMVYVQPMLASDVQCLETTSGVLYLRNFASHTTGMSLVLAALFDFFKQCAPEAARLLPRIMTRSEPGVRNKKGFKEWIVAFTLPSQYATTKATALSQIGITGNMNFTTIRHRGVAVFVQTTTPAVTIRPTAANVLADAYVTTVSNLRCPEVAPFLLDMIYWVKDTTSIGAAVISWKTTPSSSHIYGDEPPSLVILSSSPLVFGNLWQFSRQLINDWCTLQRVMCVQGRPDGFKNITVDTKPAARQTSGRNTQGRGRSGRSYAQAVGPPLSAIPSGYLRSPLSEESLTGLRQDVVAVTRTINVTYLERFEQLERRVAELQDINGGLQSEVADMRQRTADGMNQLWEDVGRKVEAEKQRAQIEVAVSTTQLRDELELMRKDTEVKLTSYAHKSEVKEEIVNLFEYYLGKQRKESPVKQRRIDEVGVNIPTALTRLCRNHRARLPLWSRNSVVHARELSNGLRSGRDRINYCFAILCRRLSLVKFYQIRYSVMTDMPSNSNSIPDIRCLNYAILRCGYRRHCSADRTRGVWSAKSRSCCGMGRCGKMIRSIHDINESMQHEDCIGCYICPAQLLGSQQRSLVSPHNMGDHYFLPRYSVPGKLEINSGASHRHPGSQKAGPTEEFDTNVNNDGGVTAARYIPAIVYVANGKRKRRCNQGNAGYPGGEIAGPREVSVFPGNEYESIDASSWRRKHGVSFASDDEGDGPRSRFSVLDDDDYCPEKQRPAAVTRVYPRRARVPIIPLSQLYDDEPLHPMCADPSHFQEWPECWEIDNRLAIGASLIQGAGRGLFAKADIEADTEIGIYHGAKIFSRGVYKYDSDYTVTSVCGRLTVDAIDPRSGPMRMINDCLSEGHHSVQLRKRKSEIYVVTIRAIRALEELYVPYGAQYWWFRRHKNPEIWRSVVECYGTPPEDFYSPQEQISSPREEVRHVAPVNDADIRLVQAQLHFAPSPQVLDIGLSNRRSIKRAKERARIDTLRGITADTRPPLAWKEQCRALSAAYVQSDSTVVIGGDRTLSVGFQNVNTLNDDKIRHIAWSVVHHELDLFHAVDCRMTEVSMSMAVTMFKTLLGTETLVTYGAVSKAGEVGGYVTIIRSKWRGSFCNKHVDATGLGVAVEYSFRTASGHVTVIGCYWPARSPSKGGSLWSQIRRNLVSRQIDLSPMVYIKRMLNDRILKLIERGHRIILGGDLNHDPNGAGSYGGLHDWCEALRLCNSIAREAQQGYYTRHTMGTRKSFVDHVVHSAELIQTWGGSDCSAEQLSISDHKMVYAGFMIKPCDTASTTIRVPRVRRAELDLKTTESCAEVHEQSRRLAAEFACVTNPTMAERGQWVEALCVETACVARSLMRRPPRISNKSKNCWSMTMMVLKAQLKSMVEILRKKNGTHGRARWATDDEHREGVVYWVLRWEMVAGSFVWRSDEQRNAALGMTGRGPDFWKLHALEAPEFYEDEIRRVLKCLHGRRRKEFLRGINENCRRREQRRVDRKLRLVIGSMTNKYSPSLDMDELRVDDDHCTADPIEIHDHLTDWFDQAYKGNEGTGRGVHAVGADWHSFLENRQAFDDFLRHTTLTGELKDILWSSLRVYQCRAPEIYGEAIEAVTTAPTLQQFTAAIRNPRGGMTGGMSGCTFNMMSQWSECAITLLHKTLIEMVAAGLTPTFWNHRWLAVIPKQGERSIKNMRPITLVEVLSKLWHGFAVSALWDYLERNELMHHTNHAYRRNRGCITATMQLIDIIDTARENESSLCMCSTDVSKAFDSPSVNVQKISAARVNIPREQADRMVNEGAAPVVMVRSPYAHLTMEQRRHEPDVVAIPSTLTPRRGIGQGTKDSTIKWNMVEDITNVALAQHHSPDDFLLLRADGTLKRATNICYSDDNNPISATVYGLEKRAAIVTGVKEAMEMRMATNKWKVVGADYGNEGLIDRREMTVGDGTGACTVLAVPDGNDLRILGVNHYINVKDRTLETLRRDLTFYCNVIVRKPASVPTKIIALTASIYQKVLYKAQFSAITHKEAMQLDVPVNKFYRTVTKNMATFPTKLLYSECESGGLGFRRLSDEIQQRKLNNLLNGLHQDTDTREAYESHMFRAMRLNGYRSLSGQGAPVNPTNSKFWASSLLESFAYAGLTLRRGGDPMAGTVGEQLQGRYALDARQSSELIKFGVYTVGDIIQRSDNGVLWRDFSDTPLEFINRIEQEQIPPQEPPILGIHTMWMIAPEHAAEILGTERESGLVCVRIWISIGPFQEGGRLKIHAASPSRGAGSPIMMQFNELFPDDRSCRVITYPDEALIVNGETVVTRRILNWAETDTPRVHIPCPKARSPFATSIALAMADREYRVYTDGSYKALWTKEEILFSEIPASTKHGASVVLIPVAQGAEPIIFHLSHDDSLGADCAFPMELIPLTLALELSVIGRVSAIYSDCESIVKWINRSRPRLSHTRCTSLLLTAIELHRVSNVEIHHCSAHAERRMTRDMWGPHEVGNYVADRAAERALNDIYAEFDSFTFFEASSMEVACALANTSDWVITGKGGSPCTLSLKKMLRVKHYDRYVEERDERHHPASPSYSDASGRHAAIVWKLSVISVPARARAVRIMFNKLWMPWNMARFDVQDELGADGCCPACGEIDSQQHLICHCSDPRSREIRRDGVCALRKVQQEVTMENGAIEIMEALRVMRGDGRYWSIWTGMWQPWQRSALLEALRHADISEKEMMKVRRIFININRVMVVVAMKLFARRQEQMRIDRQALAHAVDPDRTPPPAPPKEILQGMIYEEYERLSKLGRRKLKVQGRRARPECAVREAAVTQEHAHDVEVEGPQENHLAVDPQDEEDRVEPADDRVLDFLDDDGEFYPRRHVQDAGEDSGGPEGAHYTPAGD